MNHIPRRMVRTTKAKSGRRGTRMDCISNVIAPNATRLPTVATNHEKRVASQAYVRQNATRENPPLNVPRMDDSRKALSWLKERKKMTGPDVSGRPISQPLTMEPHFRPARLEEPMIMGARTNFRMRRFIFFMF